MAKQSKHWAVYIYPLHLRIHTYQVPHLKENGHLIV